MFEIDFNVDNKTKYSRENKFSQLKREKIIQRTVVSKEKKDSQNVVDRPTFDVKECLES